MIDFSLIKDYEIKEDGYVVGLNGMVKSPWVSNGGYMLVQLVNKDGSRNHHLLHRLVASKFLPNPNNLPQVNHKDGNKFNNQVSNLEWCTQSDNMKHSYQEKLRKPTTGRLSDEQVIEMRRLREEGSTYYELGDMFGISYQSAHLICTKKQYKNVGA